MELKQGIDQVINTGLTPSARQGLKLQRAWESVAPERILSHTDNVIVSKKKADALAVFVDTPHCAASLSMSKEYYRQMMEHELGRRVSDIFFVVSKETGIRKSFAKHEQEKPWYEDDCQSIPLDEDEMAYVRMSVEDIENPELKETLLKAFVADLEWKKGKNAIKSP